ncbi:sterol-sensing domain of SREBP cleavage-activation-domain-containing protein [Trichoderma asperelloides]|nr:sterol-sensing domain of SREBP cleavage-activation-domain-containing protein [Trichoderma asperelloides]
MVATKRNQQPFDAEIQMIWYLLYPLRGTTEAPVLAPSHPFRRAVARYGRNASRNAIRTLLASAGVASLLIYPVPFLYTTDFVIAASNLPHHAWTAAQPLRYDAAITPDIIMRSIWIHSSYMQALSPDVLLSALELQDELLGTTQDFSPGRYSGLPPPNDPNAPLSPAQRDALHVVNGLTDQSWAFQSPLLYWNCSRERILADEDIVATVNDRKNQSTPANITLRHSIVFSGKRFEDRRLVAADALVITLLYRNASPVGRQWEDVAPSLPSKVEDKWDIYPANGQVSGSQLYEFKFRPITAQDSIIFAVAYAVALLYFLINLTKLRAIKSKFGLIITVIAQILLSIVSSLTICAFLNLDLSRIPRAAYPLIVLIMSLEHILRLMNALIRTPSEDSTSNRIGYAFGEIAPAALATSIQNCAILIALSRVVSPGVSEFCIFAAVAIVLDTFYLSTFFLSVLSVDVRRMELGDALAKESMRRNRNANYNRNSSWMKRILQGKIALSTRVAGTIVVLVFVFIAQSRFFSDRDISRRLSQLYGGKNLEPSLPSPLKTSLLNEIHQARSPTSWLLLQDHDAAHEIIRIIKPSAYSYIARVYEPLVFVKKGSNRAPRMKESILSPAVLDFINHQLTPLVFIDVLVVFLLRRLTAYLLPDDKAKREGLSDSSEEPSLGVKTLSGGHSLDIAMLAYSSGGYAVSVGLDRKICLWSLNNEDRCFTISDPERDIGIKFPVLAIAIDEDSDWLAILSSDAVAFWNIATNVQGPTIAAETYNQKPTAFFLDPNVSSNIPRPVIVWKNGTVVDIEPASGESREFMLCSGLTCARQLISIAGEHQRPNVFLIATSRNGDIHVVERIGLSWGEQKVFTGKLVVDEIHQVVPLSPLPYFLASSKSDVHLINLNDGSTAWSFSIENLRPRSLDCAFSCHRASNAMSIGLKSFTLSYQALDSGDGILHTFTPHEDDDAIFLQNNGIDRAISGWCGWSEAVQTTKRIDNPGVWRLLYDGSAIGLRRRPRTESRNRQQKAISSVRNRLPNAKSQEVGAFNCWELWRAASGDRQDIDEITPLFPSDEDQGQMIVCEPGPGVKFGESSVAFAFGNVIKVATLSGYKPSGINEVSHESLMNMPTRRRKGGTMARPTGT